MTYTSLKAPSSLRSAIDRIENASGLDALAETLAARAARVSRGRRGEVLEGRWLGHALHPLLTDFPLGAWAAAGILDLFGGKKARPAAQRLVGFGLLMVPPTVAAGLADYANVDEPRMQRVGAAHAAGNTVVAACYFASWRARRARHHLRGVFWGLTGGILAWGTGYLGGHLSFGRGVGIGERGLSDAPPDTSAPQAERVAFADLPA